MTSHPDIARPWFLRLFSQTMIGHSGPEPDRSARHERLRSTARAAHRWSVRLAGLSWPRRYPVVQFPNAPLILAFLAGQAAGHLHGTAHPYASAVAYLAMIVWAYEEVAHGVNRFRNLLGLAYAVSTVVHLAAALHH